MAEDGPRTETDFDYDKEEISYIMRGKKKSIALIFNHMEFENGRLESRKKAATLDGIRLQNVLEKLNFEVRYHEDLTRDELLTEIEQVKEGHEDRDCLLVTVMTHGEKSGFLYAKDYSYRDEEIWRTFENSESLRGKPKIFLFQCCRGERRDEGVHLLRASLVKEKGYVKPKGSDFFIVHSTLEGYTSWKSPDGSWFIQDLCKQLEKNAAKKDLARMMPLVANSMSKRLSQAKEVGDSSKKQVPITTSTLTKLMYL